MAIFEYDSAQGTIQEEVIHVSKVAAKKYLAARVYVVVWSEFMYELWLCRRLVVYQSKQFNLDI